MKLYYNKNSKDPIYYIQKGYRFGNKTTSRNIARIGKHSELLEITDDPLAYAKEQVKKYNEEEEKNKNARLELTIDFSKPLRTMSGVSSTASRLLNIGYLYLQQIYQNLGIHSFFSNATAEMKPDFDLDLVNRFLVYSRILCPDYKPGAFGYFSRFLEQPEIDYEQVLTTMDFLEDHGNEYLTCLYEHSSLLFRHSNTLYCFCSSYYPGTEVESEDFIDEMTGEYFKDLRRFGLPSESKSSPVVETVLLMDPAGIPLSIKIVPGNSEQISATNFDKKARKQMRNSRIIYCADAGIDLRRFWDYKANGGNDYILTLSVRDLPESIQQEAFNEKDYRLLSTDQPANLEILKTFSIQNKKNLPLYNDVIYKVLEVNSQAGFVAWDISQDSPQHQRVIITFSRKLMEYQRTIRNRQIERSELLQSRQSPITDRRTPSNTFGHGRKDYRLAEKKETDTRQKTDQSPTREDEKFDGFRVVVTNVDLPATEIFQICSKRFKLEEFFWDSNAGLSSHPVFRLSRERITASCLISYTALLLFQILKAGIEQENQHFQEQDIIETIKNMNIANMDDLFYFSTYNSSDISMALEKYFPLGLQKKYYQPKVLNRILKTFSS